MTRRTLRSVWSHYLRVRKRLAEARLESAKSNLTRVFDILEEVSRQVNSLRRQAGKTRRFIALQEEFRGRLRELFAAEGRHYSELIERLKAELETAVTAETELAEKVSGCELSFRKMLNKCDPWTLDYGKRGRPLF